MGLESDLLLIEFKGDQYSLMHTFNGATLKGIGVEEVKGWLRSKHRHKAQGRPFIGYALGG